LDEFHYYKAFGKVIKSPVVLPDFVSVSARHHDALITEAGRLRKKIKQDWFIKEQKGAYLLYFRELGLFKIKKNEIKFYTDGGELTDFLHLYICGLVIGAFILKEGYVVLHASAICSREDKAIMFIGNSGAGKSSTVAGLIKKGLTLLSDDVVALNPNDDLPIINTGKVRLHLEDDMARILFGNTLKREKNPFKKKYYLESTLDREKIGKLNAIYFLDIAEKPSVSNMPVSEALFQLLGNSMQSRFFKVSKKELEYFVRLIKKVPIFKFTRSNNHKDYFYSHEILMAHMVKNGLV